MAKNTKNSQFEDVSSFNSNADYRRANKAKRKKHKGLKALICVFCVLLILVGSGMLFISNYLLADLTTTTITKDKDALGIVSGVETNPNITNIALFGVDSRDDNFSGLSDVIIICTVDEIHHKVKLTSILRDSRVYIGEKSQTASGYDKINAAYSLGGAELAINTINQSFKMDITDYVTVNFGKTAAIVDAFGGVDLEITEAEREQININLTNLLGEEGEASGITDIDYISESGMVHMTGNTAVAYSRIRMIDSDTMRANRQQNVLEALVGKLTSFGIGDYPQLIKRMCALAETSLDFTTIFGFADFAISDFTLERLVVPGELENPAGDTYYDDYPETGSWEWRYDLDLAADHIHEFIYEDLYDSETGLVEGAETANTAE
ncbi:MAG: LCP family protein [Clostridia bacterium]|nr:LCP family protein [Clostridia bacterium]